MKRAVLRIDGVSKLFGYHEKATMVLRDLSISFTQGTTYAITGVSGTGKSTMLYVLAGLEEPTAGAVYSNDNNILHFSEQEKALFLQKSVGLLFQNPYLIRELSVEENVMMPGLIARMSRDACKIRAHELLGHVGMMNKASSAVGALSGGQQQRVSLARALFHTPDFLLADEPTGNLDEQTGYGIVQLLTRCQQEWGMGVIVCTHDAYVAQSMQVRYQLRDGQLHEL